MNWINYVDAAALIITCLLILDTTQYLTRKAPCAFRYCKRPIVQFGGFVAITYILGKYLIPLL
jgi:hypothetical protein